MIELILSSGAIGVAILVLFFAAVFIFIERLWFYNKQATDLTNFSVDFDKAVQKKDYEGAIRICDDYGGVVADVYGLAVRYQEKGPATLRNLLYKHIDLDILPMLRSRLGLLATIGKAAPMLGLLGTVYGMMAAFSSIAGTEGQGVDPKDLAGSIGQALGTTFLGLLVALPVAFALTYLRAKLEKFEVDLEQYSQRCLDLLF